MNRDLADEYDYSPDGVEVSTATASTAERVLAELHEIRRELTVISGVVVQLAEFIPAMRRASAFMDNPASRFKGMVRRGKDDQP